MVDHSNRKHALLSASGASRWLNCTPSPRLEDQFPEKSSDFAKEGTLAHEFADQSLRFFNGELTEKEYNTNIIALKKHELFSREMPGYVKVYVDEVISRLNEAQSRNKALLFVEEKLDFSHVAPKGFGTGDGLIVSDGIIEVIDLKYGKGVKVEAQDNSQLKLYGLGALKRFDLMYDIKTVRLTVIQPRLFSISSWDISVEDLHKWADEIRPTAEIAFAGLGEHKPGSWCRWCKAKATCRAFANQNLEVAKSDFAEPATLTDEELLEIYEKAPAIADWAKSVAKYVHEQAVKGKTWNGYKLVHGRGRRKIINEEKVIETLKELDFEPDEFMTTKLAGIVAISSLLSVDAFEEFISPYIEKIPGKPALVKQSDDRIAFGLQSAKNDFSL